MIKKLLKKSFSLVYYNLYKRFSYESGHRILLYHSIGSKLPYDTYGISISSALFERHMALLRAMPEVQIGSLEEASDNDESCRIAVTFDDGYRDNLYVAAPIMMKYGMPFTVFVTVSYIQSGDPVYMSSKELRELAFYDGVTIGSHGMTHAHLAECDDKTLKKELCESRSYLEDIIGKPVTSVSYPHGSVNRRVRDAAMEAGYKIGGCSLFGVNELGRDPLLLRRTEVLASDTEKIFRKKLSGAWDWYAWLQKYPAD